MPLSSYTPRARVLQTLRHHEPDRVPHDLASTQVTAISNTAYANLRTYLGLPAVEPNTVDVVQQVCIPHDDVMQRLAIDTRGLFPRISVNWNIDIQDDGDYWSFVDEWHCKYRRPKRGLYFSLCESPLAQASLSKSHIDSLPWPDPADPRRWAGLRERAEQHRAAGYAVVMRALCAGILEMACRLRPMDQLMMDLALGEEAALHLLAKITELKARFWEAALADLGDVVDVVAEADDYGTQQSMLVSPDMYRRLLKPLQAELFAVVRKRAPESFIFFHSCGNVRGLIPDFIEIGVDILNPVHITAVGMEPAALKRDFGREISFWGGGVDTQGVLPNGTPQQVRDDVRRNVAALAPGGGYVFNTVHNIQADVPPENIMAMFEALEEVGRY